MHITSAISFVVLTSATSFSTFISVGVSDSSAGISLASASARRLRLISAPDNTGLTILVAGVHAADRAGDLRDCALFRHIPVDARVERRIEERGVAVQAQHDEASRGAPIAYRARHVETVAAGHVDVEDGDVRTMRLDRRQRGVAVRRLGDQADGRIGLDDMPQTGAEDRVIVRDQHGDDRGHSAGPPEAR